MANEILERGNEFFGQRLAVLEGIAPIAAATTLGSSQGVYIPAGAIITGVRVNAVGAQTNLTDASATVALRVGTDPVISTVEIKNLGAGSVPVAMTLLTAGGVYVPHSGVLNVIQQASANSAYTGTHDFYVEYLMKAA